MKINKKIIFAIYSCFILSCNRDSLRNKEINQTDTRKETKHNETIVDYHIKGKGDTALLFVHDVFLDQTYWKEQVDYFGEHYLVVTLDLPGHGKSGKTAESWTLEEFADNIINVVNKLNLKNVVLIGHSLAGDINLIVASRMSSPIIGFIGVDNFKEAGKPQVGLYKQVLDSIGSDSACTQFSPQTPPDVVMRVKADFRNAADLMGGKRLSRLSETGEIEQHILPKLGYKLYLINVNNTPTNEKALKKYTGSGYEIFYLKGTSHYPMIESPDMFNLTLQKVINKMGRS